MGFDYFYEDQTQQFAFYRIPKVLFTDARFQGISTEGKVLYGLLLDRVSLSRDNGWIDEEGRVYIIFTLTSIREAMNCSEKSAIKYLSELEEFGLIERIKQGLGKPALIYVKNFLDQQNLQVRTCIIYSLIILITIILNIVILILSYPGMRSGWDMKHTLGNSWKYQS